MPSRRSPKVLILITLLTAGFLSLGSFAFLYAQVAEPAPAPYRYVKVQGRQVWVDFDKDGLYTPYFIRGVGYEPTPIGRHVSDWGWPALYPRTNNIFEETAALDRDFTLLRDMNANTIRIWKANSTLQPDGRYPNLLTTTTLTKAKAYGLKVIPGFWIGNPGYWQCTGGGPVYTISIDFTNTAVRTDIINRFAAFVTSFKNREEILFWAIGNEENLSLNRNTPTQVQAFYSLMNAMGAKVREIEGANYYHPVAIVNGELGFIGESGFGARDSDLPNIDIWGANVYRGENFGTLFTEYQAKSTKPLWLSEFGIDAFNAVSPSTPAVGQENQALQATWDGELWEELVKNSMVNIGGTLMAYSDNWWKPREWDCEDHTVDECRTSITAREVNFNWAARPGASKYYLYVSTYAWGSELAAKTITAPNATVLVTGLPVNGGNLYVRLAYDVPGVQNGITEYYVYPTPSTPQATRINFKIRQQGMKQNHFGFGPRDESCPADGIPDYYPAAPDNFFHEEWWGVVSISRNAYNVDTVTPRQVYSVLQSEFLPQSLALSNGAPSGTLPYNTTQTTISLSTNRKAWCRYGTSSATPFYALPSAFSSTGSTSHSQTITGLANGTTYNYYVRCQDTAGNITTTGYPISFSVASADVTKPDIVVPPSTLANGVYTFTAQVTDTGSGVNPAKVTMYARQATNYPSSNTFVYGGLKNPAMVKQTGDNYTANIDAAWFGPAGVVFTVTAYDNAGNYQTTGKYYHNRTTLLDPDVVAPTVPTGLTATALSMSEIRLQWTAATDASGFVNYEVYRNGNYVGRTAQGVLTYTDTNLVAGTNYRYTVRARDIWNNFSALSTAANAITLRDTQAPTTPTGLTATPYPTAGTPAIYVYWQASTDNSGVVNYEIYRDGVKVANHLPAYLDQNLITGRSYSYQIRAVDRSNNYSVYSNTAVAVAPKPSPTLTP